MKCDGIANHRSAKQRLSAAKKSNGIARRRIEWTGNGWAYSCSEKQWNSTEEQSSGNGTAQNGKGRTDNMGLHDEIKDGVGQPELLA